MKKPLFQKLTALLLAFAMTLSLAGAAFAEDLTQDADNSAAAATVLPSDGEEETAEENTGSGDAENTDGNTEEQEEKEKPTNPDAEPTDNASDSGNEPTDDGADQTDDTQVPDVDPMDDPNASDTDPADGSGSTSTDGNLVPQSAAKLGWNATVTTSTENGETVPTTVYSFVTAVNADGSVTMLKNGYYQLPAEETTDSETGDSVTYQAGIYYFDKDGKLAEEAGISKVEAEKTDKKTEAIVLKRPNTANYYTYYKKATYDEATAAYTLSDSIKRVLAIVDASADDGKTDPTVKAPYALHSGRVAGRGAEGLNLWCINGSLYSGFWRCSTESGYDTRLFWIKNGKGHLYKGKMNSASAKKLGITAQYYCNGKKQSSLDGKVYCKGVVFTGIFTSADANNPDYGYYKKGVLQKSINGWRYYNSKTKKWSSKPFTTKTNPNKQIYGVINKVYYFKNGYVIHGKENVKLSSMDGSGTKYYYTFNAKGQLVTNLFSYKSAYRYKKLKIIVSRKNHTCTIFAYNSKTKKYDIPCKSFVVATAKKTSKFKVGTYKLGSQKAWMNDQQAVHRPLSKCSWYRYATHISGAGALFHSSNYWAKGNTHGSTSQMKGHIYNQLGTNVTAACVRCQLVNCKLVYKLRQINKNITVQLGYSSTNDAFGTMTLGYNFDQTGGTVGKKAWGKAKNSTTDPTENYKVW